LFQDKKKIKKIKKIKKVEEGDWNHLSGSVQGYLLSYLEH